MAKQPRNIQEELTQITDEFRIMHARVNGETHAQAARGKEQKYSKYLQRDALKRWNCKTLEEYKAMHVLALHATMAHIRFHANTTDPDTRWGQHLAITHEYLSLMHELASPLPTSGEHKTGEPRKRVRQGIGIDHQVIRMPPVMVRRVWARVVTP